MVLSALNLHEYADDNVGPMQDRGLYHLFYQYDALSATGTGPKSWGHAISEDLVHWACVFTSSAYPLR